jgi:SWI/SNF-related matrix-associated actin-dependent regulator 1 of chromatin subfamily A
MDVEWVDSGELAALDAALAAAERRGGGAHGAVAAAPPQQQQQPWQAPAGAYQAPQQHDAVAQQGGYGAPAPVRSGYFTHAAPPSGGPPQQLQQQQRPAQPPHSAAAGSYQPYQQPAAAVAPAAGGYGGGNAAQHPPLQGGHAPAPAYAPAPPPQQQCRIDLRLLPDTRVAISAWPHPAASSPVLAALEGAPSAAWDAQHNAWLMPATSVAAATRALRSAGARVDPLPPIVAGALEFLGASLVPDDEAEAAWQRVPAKLRESMYPFQRTGVRYALSRAGRALIGDEMGLGKTVQAIALMAAYRSDWPALVLCPASLRDQWASSLVTWLPEELRPTAGVRVVASGKDVAAALANVGRRDIVVVPYSLVAKCADALLAARFGCVVADESHCLKDAKAQRTKGAAPLLRAARRAICLTGTPALSRPGELFPQLNALQPRIFAAFTDYAARFCAGGRFGFAQGCSNSAELHGILAAVLLVRRLKKDVLTELPPKLRSLIALPVPPSRDLAALREELAVAQKGGDAMRTEAQRLMTRLYTDSAAHKAPACAEYMATLVDGATSEDKFLFFGHHTALLDAVAQRMTSERVAFIRIDGSTPVGERAVLVEKFQRDDRVRVAVLSIKAAGVGLTLTAASTVVFGELSWTPGDVVQAEDRAHRIGQRGSVAIHILQAKGTCDDFLWRAIQHKLDKLGHVLDGNADSMAVEKHVNLEEGGAAGGAPGGGAAGGAPGDPRGGIRGFFAPRQPLQPRANAEGAPAEAACGAAGWDAAWEASQGGWGGAEGAAGAPAEAGGAKRPRTGGSQDWDAW